MNFVPLIPPYVKELGCVHEQQKRYNAYCLLCWHFCILREEYFHLKTEFCVNISLLPIFPRGTFLNAKLAKASFDLCSSAGRCC